MDIRDLGLIGYKEAEALQLKTLEEVTAGERGNTLFVLEHPKVITLGRQGGAENLHVDENFLKGQGIELAQTARGGNITCHFPGQLVAYPIWRVEKRPGGMKRFFHDMEKAVINTCAHFGVSTRRRPGHPGVWVDDETQDMLHGHRRAALGHLPRAGPERGPRRLPVQPDHPVRHCRGEAHLAQRGSRT